MDINTKLEKLKKSRNMSLLVGFFGVFGALMRWFGIYGSGGAGTIDWFTIIIGAIGIGSALFTQSKISSLSKS